MSYGRLAQGKKHRSPDRIAQMARPDGGASRTDACLAAALTGTAVRYRRLIAAIWHRRPGIGIVSWRAGSRWRRGDLD